MAKEKDKTDEELLGLFAQSEDPILFSEIYKRHVRGLTKYFIWLSSDPNLAKDMAQEVFMKIYGKPSSFDPEQNFKVWLYSVAGNHWKNQIRTHSNRIKFIKAYKDLSLPKIEFEEALILSDKHQRVQSAMKLLTENQRSVILLKYSNNLTIREISQVLDCSEGTIKSRLFYAILKLKEIIYEKSS